MIVSRKRSLVAGLAAAGLAFAAGPAFAYIGPGAGLSLLGALWGVIAAVAAAVLFLLLWPLRRMMRRKRPAAGQAARQRSPEQPTPEQHTPEQRRQPSSPSSSAARGR
ncbi:MAG TPA: hypothetical protein VKP12_08715 [Kiloniellaceae bacterium]|nr:hypothetical protein [Kiloniellaceae bacterium]